MQEKNADRFTAEADDIRPLGRVVKIIDLTTEQQKRDNAEHERILRELAKDPVR